MSESINLFDLTGKVALITGGSRGLGLAMSHAFAAAGANVVIASRKLDNCIEAATAVQQASGREALGVKYHAGEWADNDTVLAQTLECFGRIDILVNNAGMSPLYKSLAEISESLYDKVLEVNLRGPFRLSALAGEHMAAAGGGSIINVSSVAAVQPSPIELPYGMAKAGLNTMTLGLARAYAPKVRVNCIMPGPFLTDISKAWDLDAFRRNAERNIPLGRGGEPEEVIGAALYFASAASSYTTGAILKIDGGSVYPAA
ncbi:MAG: SDR family oxidoreductase [Pseudomonadales bacterium]|nr:SDR family oxidoreductase [Pseudomonadales bacterium]